MVQDEKKSIPVQKSHGQLESPLHIDDATSHQVSRCNRDSHRRNRRCKVGVPFSVAANHFADRWGHPV